MKRWRRLPGSILLTLAIELFMSLGVMLAQSAAVPLRLGDPLPDVVGQNLFGNPTHLSATVRGKVAVVIFSFSKSGGKDTQLWNKELLRDFGSDRSVALSTVIMLESAPRLLRGFIVSGIKNDMPPSLHGSTIVSYEEEKLWKQRLAVTDDSHAYVLLLGQESRIFWMNSGAYSSVEYKELKTRIQEQLHSSTPRKSQ